MKVLIAEDDPVSSYVLAARIRKMGHEVLVTENGLASTDDTRRVEYFRRALRCVADCLQEDIDVRGYFCWSALDNFEWNSGYRPKFGIIAVNRETQQRTPKPSAAWLGGGRGCWQAGS